MADYDNGDDEGYDNETNTETKTIMPLPDQDLMIQYLIQ